MDSSKQDNQQSNSDTELDLKKQLELFLNSKAEWPSKGPTEKFWNRLGIAAIVLASLGGVALMIWASSGH